MVDRLPRRSAEEGCTRVTYSANVTFVHCKPPGAFGVRYMRSGVEEKIGTAILTMIKQSGGWQTRPRVVDVGMNEGLLTLMSAAAGARVLAVDLAPACFENVQRSAKLSSLAGSIHMRNVGLAAESSIPPAPLRVQHAK